MDDLIDRDMAIHELEAFRESCIANLMRMSFDDITDVVKGIPTVNRWIPVEYALPENNEKVWVCLYWEKDAYVRKGYIKNELWYTYDGYRMRIIPKFWMPEYIPKPPEKE